MVLALERGPFLEYLVTLGHRGQASTQATSQDPRGQTQDSMSGDPRFYLLWILMSRGQAHIWGLQDDIWPLLGVGSIKHQTLLPSLL